MEIIRNSKKEYVYMPPVRMEKQDLDNISARAKELGFNRSEYIRYCIKQEMEDMNEQ